LHQAGFYCILVEILAMKSIVFALAPVMLYASLSAQGVFSNKTQDILEKVIQDYPNRFYDIKGELVRQTRQATEYKSTIQLPGFSSGIITRYNVSPKEDYSWSCGLTEPGGFEQAKNKFRNIYDQIKNSIITSGDQKTFILTTGQYEDPVKERKFTRIVFSLLPGVGEEKKLKVELSLREEGKGWKIMLSVYDHDMNEESAGAVTAN
jgi:hypothetical protein